MRKAKDVFRTWKVMFQIKKILGKEGLQKIFSRGQNQINRWCRAPHQADCQRNPIDRFRLLIESIVGTGEGELARELLNYLAEPLDCRLREVSRPRPDKPTVAEECLDDFPELVRFHGLIQSEESISVVFRQAELAKNEIDQTVVRYEEK